MIRLKQILLEQETQYPKISTPVTTGHEKTKNPGQQSTSSLVDDISKKILNKLNVSVTEEKLKFMRAWVQAEHGRSDVLWNNPFNTTQPMRGGETLKPVNCLKDGVGKLPNEDGSCPTGYTRGVRSYTTMDIGIEATVKTIQNGYYPNLLEKLRNDDITAADLADTKDLITWGTGSLVSKILKSKWSYGDKKPSKSNMVKSVDLSAEPGAASIIPDDHELFREMMIKLKSLI